MKANFGETLKTLTRTGVAFSFSNKLLKKRTTYVHTGDYAGLWVYRLDVKRVTWRPIHIVARKELVTYVAGGKTKKYTLPIPALLFGNLTGQTSRHRQAYRTMRVEILSTTKYWNKYCDGIGIDGTDSIAFKESLEACYSVEPNSSILPLKLLVGGWLNTKSPKYRNKFVQSYCKVGLVEACRNNTRLPPKALVALATAEDAVQKSIGTGGWNPSTKPDTIITTRGYWDRVDMKSAIAKTRTVIILGAVRTGDYNE